jgi:hypothetical protein
LIDEELSVTRYLPANLLVMGEGHSSNSKGKSREWSARTKSNKWATYEGKQNNKRVKTFRTSIRGNSSGVKRRKRDIESLR